MTENSVQSVRRNVPLLLIPFNRRLPKLFKRRVH